MGFFSWLTCDTQETLWNTYTGKRRTFYVLMPDGYPNLKFQEYDGYGRFIDKDMREHDAFVLLADMNGWIVHEDNLENLREIGISLCFYPEKFKTRYHLKISFDSDARYEDWPRSEECPNQGYFNFYPANTPRGKLRDE